MISIIKPKQLLILRALGQFTFLNYNQFITLGIDKYKSNLSNLIKGLRESRKPLVKKIPHNFSETAVFYLTRRGAKVLSEIDVKLSASSIHFPKGAITRNTQDAVHREQTINLQIAFELFCKENHATIILCQRYFDSAINSNEKKLKSSTGIIYEGGKSLKSDMVILLEFNHQKELFLLELERGKNTKKAVEKCIQHAKALLLGSANRAYNFKKGYRILFVFEYKSLFELTLKALKKESFFDNIKEYFLFKTLEQFNSSNLKDGWVSIAEEKRKMYY